MNELIIIPHAHNYHHIFKGLYILMAVLRISNVFSSSIFSFSAIATNKFMAHFRSFGQRHPLNFGAIVTIFPFPQTSIRKLLVCDQWLTPAVIYLVQCSFQALHKGVWRRWYTFKQLAFSCKEIFSTFLNRWYCAGAIV